jgi:hypothetical protein
MTGHLLPIEILQGFLGDVYQNVLTGRWLVSSDRAYHFPSKCHTFTIHDRVERPFAYWLGVISIPIFFLLFFVCSLSLAVAAFSRL